jgi:hypothetical protein
VGAYSGRNQASIDYIELILVVLKTKIDIVDFAPVPASENQTRANEYTSCRPAIRRHIAKTVARKDTDGNGVGAMATYTTCMGTRSTATQEQWGKSLATSNILTRE